MNYFDMYIILIFIVKLAFVSLAIYKLYIKTKKPENKKLLETLEFWKKRIEFIFVSLMSILLVYLFNPRTNHLNMIDGETKLLLYLFGFVLLLTENWSTFIYESPWFKKLQTILQ
jgi:cytochrome c oxidase assembly protein Cox11